jgi:hypothetical protein
MLFGYATSIEEKRGGKFDKFEGDLSSAIIHFEVID